MKKTTMMAALLLAAMLMALMPAPAIGEAPERVAGDARLALEDLVEGRYQALYDRFDDDLKAELPVEDLQNTWEWVIALYGDFEELLYVDTWNEDGISAAQLTTRHINASANILLAFDEEGTVLSLAIEEAPEYRVEPPLSVPEGATEEGIVLRAGEADETQGSLVLPAGDGPFDAVVLLHDFGAFDRDMASYGVRPFRDIAMGLAEEGVASLRYDKFTYAHADMVDQTLTVDREYGQDLRDALALLAADARIDTIYLLGLGQGAMLTPRYLQEHRDTAAGAIMLAGSPRPLWDVHWTRNEEIIKTFSGELYQQARPMIDAEVVKARRLDEMSDDELATETVFGVAASYQKDMTAPDPVETVLALEKPLLILQAEKDYQMTTALDYEAWQKALADAPFATFKLYPDLNHLFIALEGTPTNTAEDYYGGGHVSAEVISDIADWIESQDG